VNGDGIPREAQTRVTTARHSSLVCLLVLAACGKEAAPAAPKTSGRFVAPAANTLPAEPPPKLAYADVT
jgi:hypothetical protein